MPLLWAGIINCPAESDLGLITRPDWFGDPYLSTNPSGSALSLFRVSLVLNPLLVTNPDYQTKVSTLAATKISSLAGTPLAKFFDWVAPARVEPETSPVASRVASLSASRSPPTVLSSAAAACPLLIQRWGMFAIVVAFLARRIWRYFREVPEEDDFADHLSTLAVAHRWIFPVYLALIAFVAVAEFFGIGNFFFSASILFLAASLRRYYCDGHFADSPWAQKVHLGLRCALIWLGWMQGYDNYLCDLAAWFHWSVLAWILLALATAAFSQFYNHQDFAEHRAALYWFGLGFLFFGVLGSAAGYYFWRTSIRHDSALWLCLGTGVLVAWSPLLVYFRKWSKQVSDQVVGRMLYDMIFSENAFAERPRKQRRLPELLLLRHWRDHGQVEKAWQTAQRHLFKEARALPIWLFAMETAVLHRRKPAEALQILGRLCDAEVFHYDHRTVAVAKVQDWMAAAGFQFDPVPYKIEQPPLAPTALTDKVEQQCRQGRFGEAVLLLRQTLDQDSLNDTAFIQLARIYCQDLKNRPAAEKLIAEASETFGPKFLDFLSRSLDEWMQMPNRSQVKPWRFLGWLRGTKAPAPAAKRISLIAPPITRPAKPNQTSDPVVRYLNRVKQSHGPPPDTTLASDAIEKLLLERRLGTAVELLKQQAEAQPDDFDLWLRYAEAHGHHCSDLHTAEKVIQRMAQSGNFRKAQMKKAQNQLKKWRKKHASGQLNW